MCVPLVNVCKLCVRKMQAMTNRGLRRNSAIYVKLRRKTKIKATTKCEPGSRPPLCIMSSCCWCVNMESVFCRVCSYIHTGAHAHSHTHTCLCAQMMHVYIFYLSMRQCTRFTRITYAMEHLRTNTFYWLFIQCLWLFLWFFSAFWYFVRNDGVQLTKTSCKKLW